MKITHIASECAPFAKSGGLGDVVYGLSRKTKQLGLDVDVIIPQYGHTKDAKNETLFDSFPLSLDGETFEIQVTKTYFHDITVYSISSTHSRNLFNRQSIYGEEDDCHRFLCFCYFALAFLERRSIATPNILHLHDWPTGFCAAFLRLKFQQLSSSIKATVLTIHNLKHQGILLKSHMEYFHVNVESIPQEYEQSDNSSYINIIKASIHETKKCIIVSPTYLKEILTPECGEGLKDFIKQRLYKFSAILNGIDTDYWNPETDPLIHRNFRTNELVDNVIESKYRNKHYLQKKLNLPISHEPLFIFITRLVDQKGPHLILEAIRHITKQGCQAILLGSEPPSDLKELFKKEKMNPQVYIDFSFQEELSHLCYAAADAIIIPSIYEPCGLTQMIGMRYGTIPIARKTGGLSDTVNDVEYSSVAESKKNGFTFEYATLDSMDYIVNRALKCYKEDHEKWKILIKNCLNYPVGFEEPAKKYMEVYNELLT